MAEIPEDIKSGLKNLATSSKVEPKVLVEELKQIMANDDTIKAMPAEQAEFKIRYAWALLCRRHTMTGQTSQMFLRPFSKPRGGKTKAGKMRADVFAVIKRITNDDEGNPIPGKPELAAGTLWEKAGEAATKISTGKVYKVSLSTKEVKATPDGGATTIEGIELGGNDATFIETTEVAMPTNEEFYKEYLEPKEKNLLIQLDEMDLHNRANRIDIRVIKAMIIDYRTGERADKTEYGQYVVTDDSMLGGGEGGKPGSYTFWIHPEDVIHEKGVTLKCVGAVNYDKNKNIARWDYFFSIPVGVGVKRKIESKQPEKKTETINPDELEDSEDDITKPKSDEDFAI